VNLWFSVLAKSRKYSELWDYSHKTFFQTEGSLLSKKNQILFSTPYKMVSLGERACQLLKEHINYVQNAFQSQSFKEVTTDGVKKIVATRDIDEGELLLVEHCLAGELDYLLNVIGCNEELFDCLPPKVSSESSPQYSLVECKRSAHSLQ
jgi:hypothetical protein